MTAGDAPAVTGLNGELGYPSTEPAVTERIVELSADPQQLLLVAEMDGGVVGWIHAAFKHSLVEVPTVQVMGLVVGEGSRNAGIGLVLLQAAERWAAERGVRRVIVASRVTRERAHRFYLRHGYALHKTSHWFEKRLGHGAGGDG